ncbi:MAG TPA: YitT family protein [Firmicutes bacterium]|nr:YitT family protein [Bacillota bacterium]
MRSRKRSVGEFRREVRDYIGIFAGINLTALALVWFLIPNKIAAGGVSGLATILYYLWGWPVSLVIFSLNTPLLLICLKIFGPRFGAKTFFGAIFLGLAVEYWGRLVTPLTLNPLLASLYGGVLAGIGMGLAFRCQGTTGGTDLAARIIQHYTPLSVGNGLLLIDGLVVALAGLVFRTPEAMLYALISLGVTSKAIDGVLEGLNYSKGVFIISDRAGAIAQRILTELGRGVTGLSGKGLYSGRDKEVLLCVIGRAEEIKLKQLVKQEDPAAFMIITNVHEVLGEGFSEEMVEK